MNQFYHKYRYQAKEIEGMSQECFIKYPKHISESPQPHSNRAHNCQKVIKELSLHNKEALRSFYNQKLTRLLVIRKKNQILWW